MHWMVATIMVLAELVFASTGHAQIADHKKVLVLYSTRRDAQFSTVGESELPRILDDGLARNLDYYAEFIDATRFPDRAYRNGVIDFLRVKYQDVRFDLVIALQDAAIEFVSAQGTPLFSHTPVVFLTNTPGIRRLPNSTGVLHERNYVATIDLVRQLQPDVQNVFVVTGAGPSDDIFGKELRRQMSSSNPRVRITYLSGMTTTELEDRLSKLPPHSAVYHALFTEDATGKKFHPLEYVDRVAAAANAPTYCWVDSAIGHGIVGGSLYSQHDAIGHVGRLALRVLGGESADSIPITTVTLHRNEVDWRVLRRWRIDERRLPAGTIVRFRNPTIWDRYSNYLLGGLALFMTQTALITGLLIQRRRRHRAEAELRANQHELRRSYDRNRALGARLLKAQESERSRIAGELHDDICQRMLVLTVELELLGRANRHQGPAAEALTVARDISKSLHELSHRLHPTRLRMLGLVSALEHLCVELSRAGLTITFTHDLVPSTLAPEVMLCVFRVVQESLQNALKHSQAKDVSVQLRYDGAGLTVTIVDSGVGFDVEAAWGNGVGLVSMVERLEAVGGTLRIDSRRGEGTRLTATVATEAAHDTDESPSPLSAASESSTTSASPYGVGM